MSEKQYPSVDYLRQCFREESGKIFWNYRSQENFRSIKGWKIWNKRFAGSEAGYLNVRKNGDRRWLICLDSRMFLRYQIIWAMHTGQWTQELDHKNRISTDDRIDNLRPATQSQNMANGKVRATNTSGFKGVRWRPKTKKWQAIIRMNRKAVYLGQFTKPEDAHAAYVDAAIRYFGEFAFSG
jgi:hypothetical protein